MTQEDKDILLKDLCGRLPYGVKCKLIYSNHSEDATLFAVDKYCHFLFAEFGEDVRKFVCKPYLFPLSSMTEEQKEELKELCNMYGPYHDYDSYENQGIEVFEKIHITTIKFTFIADVIDWLNKNHFDYRSLISMGLAIDCTNLKNIY